MNYRLQDFIKYIIPGLYIVFFAFIWNITSPKSHINTKALKDYTSIIILLIPFVGFVIGYFIECLMACIEHIFYFSGGRRPSYTILNKRCHLYIIAEDDRNKIFRQHKISDSSIDNKSSGKILQIAKQKINRENVENFRINSILSRNIFGSQTVLTIIYILIDQQFYINKLWYVSLIFSAIFLIYWIHHNHIYVKYVLAEYAKNINTNDFIFY